MMNGETVLSGAPHPGGRLKILRSPAGWYLGFTDSDNLPYTRETRYFSNEAVAQQVLEALRGYEP